MTDGEKIQLRLTAMNCAVSLGDMQMISKSGEPRALLDRAQIIYDWLSNGTREPTGE